jgi:hypothetical protein
MRQIKKNELLEHLKNHIYVRIGISKVHDIGLIAIRDIPKGVNPFQSLLKYRFLGITQSELRGVPKEVQKMILDYCAVENGKIYIPTVGFNPVHLLHFINHSKRPNVKVMSDRTTFIALRKIKKGEELFSDYSTYDEKLKPER